MKILRLCRNIYLPILQILFSLFLICSSALAESFILDPQHSAVTFRVKHMGIGWVEGRFDELEGKLDFNEKNIKSSFVDVGIKARTINTNNAKRDRHLKSSAFLEAGTYPYIRFLSNGIEGDSAQSFKVKGVLTIRNVAKEIVLESSHGGTIVDPWGVTRTAFHGSTVINRKDFGLKWNRVLESGAVLVGDEIEINLDIQGIVVVDKSPSFQKRSS